MLKAINEGILTIGENKLPVAVLEDGTRLITYTAIFTAFGRTKRGKQSDKRKVLNLPAFLNANNLQPFINEDLSAVLNPIEYANLKGKISKGYKAEILPLLCDLYLEAKISIQKYSYFEVYFSNKHTFVYLKW